MEKSKRLYQEPINYDNSLINAQIFMKKIAGIVGTGKYRKESLESEKRLYDSLRKHRNL